MEWKTGYYRVAQALLITKSSGFRAYTLQVSKQMVVNVRILKLLRACTCNIGHHDRCIQARIFWGGGGQKFFAPLQRCLEPPQKVSAPPLIVSKIHYYIYYLNATVSILMKKHPPPNIFPPPPNQNMKIRPWVHPRKLESWYVSKLGILMKRAFHSKLTIMKPTNSTTHPKRTFKCFQVISVNCSKKI